MLSLLGELVFIGLQVAYLSGVEGRISSNFQFNEDDIEVCNL